jgi:chromosome segregation ATPase
MMRSPFIQLLLLALCCAALVCQARAQPTPAYEESVKRRRQNEGLYNEMTERHAAWRKAHDEFDAAIGALLGRAATARKDPEKDRVLADLCSPAQRSRLDTTIDLLHQQLDAQSRYFKREQDDAAKAVEEEGRVITNRRELEKQRQNDVTNAEKELKFMQEQYAETESTRENVKNNPDRAENLKKALEQLAIAIEVRGAKINELQSAEGYNRVTLDSLEATRQKIDNRLRQNQDNVSIIDARRVYYEAYYSMRSAQIRQFCVDERIDRPLKD